MAYYLIMDEKLQNQSKLFAHLLTERLVDAIKDKGFKTTVVAKEVGIGQASMSRYINDVREMPTSVSMAICKYTGIDPQSIWNAAYVQASETPELSDEEKKEIVLKKLRSGMWLAANEDGNKESEKEYYPDEGA